jgi:hypothetical protein
MDVQGRSISVPTIGSVLLLSVFVGSAGCGGRSLGVGRVDAGAAGQSTPGGSGGQATGFSGQGGEGQATGSGGATGGRVPINHRPSDAQCTQTAPPGNCGCNGNCPSSSRPNEWACSSDSGCGDAGVNGRCIGDLGPAGCHCTSDRCGADSDCSTGQTCACHGSPYTYALGNECVPGNCRVDADCPRGGYCSPTPAMPCDMPGWDYCQGVAYFCHTPNDQCTDESDCVQGGGCLYSPSDGFWKCHIYAQPL